MKFYLICLLGISFLHANSIENNIIKGYANTNDSVVEEGQKAKEIIYLTPKTVEVEKRTPVQRREVITVEKDYTDANILIYKQSLDKEGSNFIVNKGEDGGFVGKNIFKAYQKSDANKKLADANKDLYKRSLSGKCLVSNDMFIRGLTNFTSNAFSLDQIGGGVEFFFKDLIVLRGAYRYEIGATSIEENNIYSGFAGGFSINVPMSKKNKNKLSLDYAYRTTYRFRGTHNFGVRIVI